MATSPASEALVESNRQAQARISAVTAALMLRLWPFIGDGGGRDQAQWLQLVLAAIRAQRAQSAALATTFYLAHRRLELPGEPDFVPRAYAAINDQQVITSMMVTGPQALRKHLEKEFKLQPGDFEHPAPGTRLPTKLPTTLERQVQAAVAGAAVRHVRNGERDTIFGAITDDPKAIGYVRVTDGDPCYFCAMLLSRGPVYKSDSFSESDPRFFGPGNAKVHDHCGCSVEPIYTRADPVAQPWLALDKQWQSAQRDAKGNPLLAWRNAYGGRSTG